MDVSSNLASVLTADSFDRSSGRKASRRSRSPHCTVFYVRTLVHHIRWHLFAVLFVAIFAARGNADSITKFSVLGNRQALELYVPSYVTGAIDNFSFSYALGNVDSTRNGTPAQLSLTLIFPGPTLPGNSMVIGHPDGYTLLTCPRFTALRRCRWERRR